MSFAAIVASPKFIDTGVWANTWGWILIEVVSPPKCSQMGRSNWPRTPIPDPSGSTALSSEGTMKYLFLCFGSLLDPLSFLNNL